MAQLSKVNPGDPITAANWNALVAAVQALSGTVSTGGISVPSFFGLTLGNAVAILSLPTTQLTVGSTVDSLGNAVDPTLVDSKPLMVLNQVPPPGTSVVSGSAVSLVVAPKPGSAPPPPVFPSITGFKPTQVPILTPVEIDGDNLTGGTATFDGVAGIPAAGNTKFKLFVVVPSGIAGAPTANPPGQKKDVTVVVTTPDGRSPNATLTILPPLANPLPVITSFNPLQGTLPGSVTITGTGFDPTPSNNAVTFDNIKDVAPTTASATQVTVAIPAGINGLNNQFDSVNVPISVKVAGQVSPTKNYKITKMT
jgi:IPT/TIG domain-containing protein